jgi:hypothetical protein
MEENFTQIDIDFINQRGNSIEKMEEQLQFFKYGIPKIILERPAIINDGIKPLSNNDADYYSDFFDKHKNNLKLKKFVPASGAASRMFKFLSEFINEYKVNDESINAFINRKKDKSLPIFLVAKDKFPFYKEVIEVTKANTSNYNDLNKDQKDYAFIKTLLSPDFFNYANKPKGILPFHQYKDCIATPIEEHLNECAFYANSNNKSNLHFTVSEEHQEDFYKIVSQIKPKIEAKTNVSIEVNYSFQYKSSDSIAVDLDNKPMRDDNGNLLFRPGGHGALINNLNNLDADVIFIKNIDNVIQNNIKTIALYKKALAGILLELQQKVFEVLKEIKSNSFHETQIPEVIEFAKKSLFIDVFEDFDKFTLENKINYIFDILNRPIRVCGMVKNEGEPGGGPFWVQGNKGKISLQIVESSQVDNKNKKQKEILESATHFNPVDLVCAIKDFEDNKFDLTKFVNPNRGFIVDKNKNGKPYKAFELPGLWNGAMSKWITVFVEVPLVTFSPVKTVNDLLKPAHQSE